MFTGQVDLEGLAWLGKHTEESRPIRITIDFYSNLSDKPWRRNNSDHLEAALQFLNRRNVSIWYWHRKLGEEWQNAHAKGYVVERRWPKGKPKAMLVGSANLTGKSLHHNFEMMGEVSEHDRKALSEMMESVEQESQPAEQKLRSLLPGLDDRTEEPLHALRGPSWRQRFMWTRLFSWGTVFLLTLLIVVVTIWAIVINVTARL